jgi:predicted dehydrogenase
MKIGIIGIGYWGPNLIRNFSESYEVEYVIGCDKNEERLKFAKSKFPRLNIANDLDTLLNSVDAVAIATPVESHFEIAKICLNAGKHIWVEKPFTSSSKQALELINLAEAKKLNIFVGHTYIYTDAVRKIKELIENNELGEILYFDSVRINLGLFQRDVNVMWDLAPHDISIMQYVLSDYKISDVSAEGIANYNTFENLAHISVHFSNGKTFAHFHVNWTSPVKIRRMIIAGSKKMLIFDDMENIEKIKVFDCGVEIKNTQDIYDAKVLYRVGDMYSPRIIQTEALSLGVKEFINSILENRKPLTSGLEGLEVVRILEAAEKSIKNGCGKVFLNQNNCHELKTPDINQVLFNNVQVGRKN